jgi:L-aminopeptidase/D-esterase-like protein
MKSRLATLLTGTAVFCAAALGVAAPAAAADTPGLPGLHNAITDVPGIQVGQVQSARAPYLTGTTVVYTPTMSVASVDQRGGAPATRETDLLNPLNSNPGVNAVMLGGSSMYGLAAADGVVRWLEERKEGVPLGAAGVAPIVPAADIYDLNRGGDPKARTTPAWGYLAAQAASAGPVAQGVVGGGTGARSGGLKGGIGTASVSLGNGIYVGAIVAVNSVGSTVDPRDCSLLASRFELNNEFRGLKTPKTSDCKPAAAAATAQDSLNTTIAVVATNAPLEKAAAARMSGNAHDGMARAINPIHTLADGDTVFAVSTGTGTALRINNPADGAMLNRIFGAAADTLSRAIGHAMLNATTVGTTKSYCDRYPSACEGVSRDTRGSAPEVTRKSLDEATRKMDNLPPVPGDNGSGNDDKNAGKTADKPAALKEAAPAGGDGKKDEATAPVAFHRNGGDGGLGSGLLAANVLLAAGLIGAFLIRRRRTAG